MEIQTNGTSYSENDYAPVLTHLLFLFHVATI